MNWHPSQLFWSQWAASDLTILQRARLGWHLRHCGACRSEHQALAQARRQFKPPPLPLLQTKRSTPLPRWLGHVSRLSAGFAVAALLVVLLRNPSSQWQDAPENHAADVLSTKGGNVFRVYLDGAAGVEPLPSRCQAGDRLRAQFEGVKPYLLIVEVDGAGAIQVLFPRGGTGSAAIEPGPHLTPGSWVLDKQSGRERFIALFSDTPIQATDVVTRLRVEGTLPPDVLSIEFQCTKGPG